VHEPHVPPPLLEPEPPPLLDPELLELEPLLEPEPLPELDPLPDPDPLLELELPPELELLLDPELLPELEPPLPLLEELPPELDPVEPELLPELDPPPPPASRASMITAVWPLQAARTHAPTRHAPMVDSVLPLVMCHPFPCFAPHESLRPIVRLNTSAPGWLSWSTQK
jgi:hypothetical protein